MSQINEVCRQIAAKFAPEAVVLFGSHARGVATADSDVDLLVVLEFEGSPMRKAGEILRAIDYSFPLDLLVRTPEQMRSRVSLKDPFITEILRDGRVLHGPTDARVA